MSEVDRPIVGRARVAPLFGISASTLKRWQSNAELVDRYRLSEFLFRLGARVATTPRLAARFVDHMQSIDPREATLRVIEEVRREECRREAHERGSKARGGRMAPVPISSEVPS